MAALEQVRLFVAVFPSAEVVQQLMEGACGLAHGLSPKAVAWIHPEQIHLTLNFLGDVQRARIGEFEQAVNAACRRGEPLFLRARGLGCFPGPARPRIIWAGVDGGGDALAGLKRTLDENLAKLGYMPDERAFHPHLTIGRVQRLNDGERLHLGETLQQWREADFGPWNMERVDLMQSVLAAAGAEYSRVQSFPLRRVTEA
jgi:2'-5' RNA ligase